MGQLIARAGLLKVIEAEGTNTWEYPDEDTATRALLSVGPAARVADLAGKACVHHHVLSFLERHRLPNGGYRIESCFRYLVARRP
jgi:hypothetical protein